MASTEESEQTFDIIIVGSGPSAIGCLYGLIEYHVQRNGSKDFPFRIGVLEKGHGPPHAESTKNMSEWFEASHTPSSSNDIYTSTPQKFLNGRIVDIPCGKGLGGGTNVNACVVRKPIWEFDFKNWPGRFHFKTNQMKDAILHLEQKMKDSNSCSQQYPCDKFLDICSGETTNPSKSSSSTHPSIEHAREVLESHSSHRTILTETSSSTGQKAFLRPVNIAVTPSSSDSSTSDTFQRANYYDALLSPLLHKYPNMKTKISFLNGIEVQRVLFQDKQATGVECRHLPLMNPKNQNKNQGGVQKIKSTFPIRASKQVILCTGAIVSPALLMVSGIGDEQKLQEAGITNIVQHLPSVGQNLRDHMILPRVFVTPRLQDTQKSLNSCLGYYLLQEKVQHGDLSDVDECIQNHEKFHYELYLCDGVILPSLISHLAAAFFRRICYALFTYLPHLLREPLLSLSTMIFFLIKRIMRFVLTRIMDPTDTFAVINLKLLNPQSTGSVSIECKSNNTNNTPIDFSMLDIKIDPNYLSHPMDLYMLSQGWKASAITAKHHFQASTEISPDSIKLFKFINALPFWKHDSIASSSYGEPPWLETYAKENIGPYFHWCGTCRMGTKDPSNNDIDEDFVVTETLNVQGVDNLRICDASVFPNIVSCPIALSCAGLGYVFGQFFADEIMKEVYE